MARVLLYKYQVDRDGLPQLLLQLFQRSWIGPLFFAPKIETDQRNTRSLMYLPKTGKLITGRVANSLSSNCFSSFCSLGRFALSSRSISIDSICLFAVQLFSSFFLFCLCSAIAQSNHEKIPNLMASL